MTNGSQSCKVNLRKWDKEDEGDWAKIQLVLVIFHFYKEKLFKLLIYTTIILDH